MLRVEGGGYVAGVGEVEDGGGQERSGDAGMWEVGGDAGMGEIGGGVPVLPAGG
jgi:hypothetical protein